MIKNNITNKPKVSIVVPVYNTSKYLIRCLKSIENQSLQNYEVLIINDGSTDSSEEICQNYISHKPQFRLINKENGGLTSARFRGWKEAKGKYILFIDSDDFIEPDYCLALYDACEENNVSLAISSYQVVTDYGVSYVAHLPFNSSIITNVKDEYIMPLISCVPETKIKVPGFLWLRMMERERITEECFVDENKVYVEDIVFDLLYAQRIDKIAVVHRPLYNYYQSPGSLTRKYRPNLWEMYKNFYDLCRQYCKNNQISQVSTRLIGAALHCTQQAAAYLSYFDFKKEYLSIRGDRELNDNIASIDLFSRRFGLLIINHKIIYIMLRFIHPRMVYLFYKWRQSR